MENILKDTAAKVLETKLGYTIEITHAEWEDAKRDTLNDIYVNMFCLFRDVTPDYFLSILVDVLAARKNASVVKIF